MSLTLPPQDYIDVALAEANMLPGPPVTRQEIVNTMSRQSLRVSYCSRAYSLLRNFNQHVSRATPRLVQSSAFMVAGMFLGLSLFLYILFSLSDRIDATRQHQQRAQLAQFAQIHTQSVTLAQAELLKSLSRATVVEHNIYSKTGKFGLTGDVEALTTRFGPTMAPQAMSRIGYETVSTSWVPSDIKIQREGFTIVNQALIQGRTYPDASYPAHPPDLPSTLLRCVTTFQLGLAPATACTRTDTPDPIFHNDMTPTDLANL